MKAFLTGSRVYGYPRPDSDVDIVVPVDSETEEAIRKLSDIQPKVVFGRLNLVLVDVITLDGRETYFNWERVTKKLESVKPVTKDFACEMFAEVGIGPVQSGSPFVAEMVEHDYEEIPY